MSGADRPAVAPAMWGRGHLGHAPCRTTHIDVVHHRSATLRTDRRSRPARTLAVAVAVALALGSGCTGGRGDVGAPAGPAAEAPSSSGSGRSSDAGGRTDAASTPAVDLQDALLVQLELRTHLLIGLAAGRTGDRVVGAAAAGGTALSARRRGVTSALLAAGIEGTGPLARALAEGDELVLAHVDAGSDAAAAGFVSRQPGVARRSAVAWSQLTSGRLPEDVAEPMTAAHLAAVVAVVDGARRDGVASAASVAASLDSTERLVAALATSLGAELGLAGTLAGDAAELHRELTSALVQDGFATAADAAGLTSDHVQAQMATDRLTGVVQRHYGPEVAVRTGDVWVAARDDAASVQVALRRLEEATRADRDVSPGVVAVAEARRRAERSAGDLAAVLAAVVDDPAIARVIEHELDDHRTSIEALTEAGVDRSAAGRWRATADTALGRTGLAAVLARAITRHKSLG